MKNEENVMYSITNAKVEERELAIFWFGQNSYVFKTHKGTLIAIDPYFSRSTPRGIRTEDFFVHIDPPVKPEEFTVDYVFCTHDHMDHTDPITLSIIAKHSSKTMFFGTPESYNHFLKMGIPPSKSRGLKENETVKIADFKVTPVNSIIGCERDEKGRKWTTHYGYIFDFGFVKLYNMGDSSPEAVAEPMKILKNVIKFSPEIAILPIIGDFPGRKPEDAFKFAKIIEPKIVIPSHYDCFKNRTINPQIFAEMFRNDAKIKPVVIEYKGKFIYRAP